MNISINAIASYNVNGCVSPNYVMLNEITYKVAEILFTRKENFVGIPTILFCCNILNGDNLQEINIRYHIRTHQWVLIGD